ncbi:hypothetical protein [Lentiprolixibacter aurantiacus]|uniref:Glycine zipper family protein n=1 Tax=Lentiprolixibacter aurantiacus TaxID=2993939 RepID=A0AAE3SQ08_9FLAO|nr:hypothetical protein [Lentiprolixibacter aurantiacus]MCX2720017.1 hypothetical protein [Lentiprolixibacter aurantiacus]
MELTSPIERTDLESRPKLRKKYTGFLELISELNSRDLPVSIIDNLNKEIDSLNLVLDGDKQFSRQLGRKKHAILKILEKELKLVPRNYYRNQWMIMGMTIFGVPMGVVLGTALDNMGFLGIGIPIGMAIGLGVGSGMDEKARKEGRQLKVTQDF